MNNETVPFLDVRASYEELRAHIDQAFGRVMSSGSYILGEEVDAFEREFAAFSGCDYAVGVGNGLDALTIALRASGIGKGDEVIVPAHTFIATWLSVIASGAEVVPVDVDRTQLLIDPSAAAAACTERTAAIVPVHLYGLPVDPEPINVIADRLHLAVIGDAAQAHGASIANSPVGSLGTAATFSFYPSKNLGAFGDGGAITSSDGRLISRARRIRNYGSESKYQFTESGVNSRLDPLQAAFLRVKLSVVAEWNQRRDRVAERYLTELEGLSGITSPARAGRDAVHSWQSFCVRHPRRDELRAHLASRGIETQIHYPVPPHLTDAFVGLGFGEGRFPVTEEACATLLSLPIGPHLGAEQVDRVIEATIEFCT